MDTNFTMLKALAEVYHPQMAGIATGDECKLIKDTLHVEEMDVLQLRNLRDFTVAIYTDIATGSQMERLDAMSAITAVIDEQIFMNGGEV